MYEIIFHTFILFNWKYLEQKLSHTVLSVFITLLNHLKKSNSFLFFEYVGFLVPPPYSAHVKTLAWNESCYRRGCGYGLYYMSLQ